MKKISSKNTSELSDGSRVTSAQLIRKTNKAKFEIKEEREPYCERCGRNGLRLDMSHLISVKEAKESKRSELAWDKKNIELHCPPCHREVEDMSKLEREELYEQKS